MSYPYQDIFCVQQLGHAFFLMGYRVVKPSPEHSVRDFAIGPGLGMNPLPDVLLE